MKATNLRYFIALGACGGLLFTARAEKVQIVDLPLELQTEIRAHTGGAPIHDIDRQVKDGRTTFEVAFRREGELVELLFNEHGLLLSKEGELPATSKVEFDQLPPLVQAAVKTRVRAGEINDIDRRVRNGEVRYEVGFKHQGVQQELLLSNTGRILRDVSYDTSLASAGPAGVTQMLSADQVQISSSRKITLREAPPEVRETILKRADGARIEDLETGLWEGRPVYQAAFKSGGEHVEVQVAASGALIHDPRLTNVGTPAASAIGTGAEPRNQPVNLSLSQQVAREELPEEVQRVLFQRLPGREIETMHRGISGSEVVYQFGYVVDGEYHRLQLDQNGNVLFDSRLAD